MVVLGGSRSSKTVRVGRVELLLPGVPGCGWLGGLEASRGVGGGDMFLLFASAVRPV